MPFFQQCRSGLELLAAHHQDRDVYLGYFTEWAAARGIGRPDEVTRAILERYQRYLFHYRKKNGKPLSFRAQHSPLVPLRALFRWLSRQHVVDTNPASELELPRLERRMPKHVLTATEAERVMAAVDIDTELGLRDRAILEVLYSTGIRRSEVIALSVWDVDAERGTLTVRQGKGNRDRMVPIGQRALGWLERYLGDVRPGLVVSPDPGSAFWSTMGEPLSPRRLTQLVKRYVDRADIGKSGACHLFRHTMATLMLEGGADIRFIQEMLGHVLLTTTQLYTQVSIRKLQQIHAATHPAATLDPRRDEALEQLVADLNTEDDHSP